MQQQTIDELVAALEAGYLLALQMPTNSLRVRNQATLCQMRDAIAKATGISAEYVQLDCERRAAKVAA